MRKRFQTMMKKIILTDIEGTTSSISFVKEVLFPYARRELPNFVRKHSNDPKVRHWLDLVQLELSTEIFDNEHLIDTLIHWIDIDRKHTALKALQGMVWVAGYQEGGYAAHIYQDAVEQLNQWHQTGHAIYVYSSGSVAAQKLFFKYSDTEVGGKREAESYQKIASAIGASPSNIIFLSDIVEELDAAKRAGLDTALVDRIEDYPNPRHSREQHHGHRRVLRFDEITL
jgi:enolase-phosphatase E1